MAATTQGHEFHKDQIDLSDVIFAIAPDVGPHWKSLIDLLGMEAWKDVQKIQHECTKTQEGSSSLAQRCTEHMFALWRSRLVQSGVSDHEAIDTLINALQIIPQLSHLADKCMDMLGRKAHTSQTEVERQTYERTDSGVFSTATGMLTEPTKSPITNSVQEGAPTLQQRQRPSTPAISASAGTATATSVTHVVQRNKSPTPSPSGDSSKVPPKQPANTSQYQNPGMLNVNSPVSQASVTNTSSGGTPLPTPQQDLGGSPVVSMHPASQPHDSYSLSQSTVSQVSSPPPSEQPPFSSPQANSVPVAAAGSAQPPKFGQDQQLCDGSQKSVMLTLTREQALLIWYKVSGQDLFRSIEWGSLCDLLLVKHSSFFTPDERDELSGDKHSSREAVNNAMKRSPQSVLHAFNQSLRDTCDRGGAIQHASIAEEIEKQINMPSPAEVSAERRTCAEVLHSLSKGDETAVMTPVQAIATMFEANPPAADLRWPSVSKLASAEHDRALHGMKGDSESCALHPSAPLQTEKTTRQPASSSALFHQQGSPQDKITAKPESQECGSEAPAMVVQQEWEVIAEFIQHFLGRNCHKDVLPTLLSELKLPHLLHSLSQEELSAKLQAVVKEHQMSFFQFAKFLLRSKATRPFIFDFTEHTGVPIRSVFKGILMRRLGADFHQLALAMNLPRADIHDIRDKPGISLRMKVDMFLSKYKFPSFPNDEETAEFLVEALESASLYTIAAEVKRDLEHELDIEEIGSSACYRPNQATQSEPNHQQELVTEVVTEDAEQQDFKKSLEAALAKGSVEVEMVKCVTLGPPEAGKTQIKSALIGNFDHSSESTPMSTRAETVIQRYIHGKSTWEPLTRERLCKSLHTTVKKKTFTESASPTTTEANLSMQVKEAQALVVEPKKIEPLRTLMHECTGVHDDGTGAFRDRGDSKKALRRQFAAIRASVEEELKKGGTAEVKGLDKIRIIHMVDSGGQPAFFDIHPVIATSRAVYLLVYNMEEGLDHKPAITYRRKEFPTKQLQNIKQSNLDMIKDSLLTLHDCKQKFTTLERELHHWFGDSISESADDTPVLVVGTRKRKESIAHESEKLAKECSYLPLWRKVLHSTDTGTKLFAVESMDPDCQGVQSVRQEVDRAGCIFKLPLPISWFLCQLIFLSVEENLHVLTFSNLRDLCQQEGLISNPDEFLAMIRTFHLLGIFSFPYLDQELTQRDHWRPDDMPIFTNPDVLYQQVTKILEMPYRDLAKTPMEPKARESLTALQSSGRLDSDTLGYLGIPDDLGFYSGFHAYLLERLVHWGLAAKPTTEISEGAAVNGTAALFIPSVLPVCDKEPVTCSESPLSFTFCLSLADGSKVHYVPRGIFPHLIVHIEGQSYEIEESTNYQSCLFRNVATFGIEPSHSNKMQYAYNVMVVDKMDRVTIAIDPAQEGKLSTADCQRIVNDFKKAMESVYEGIYQVSLTVTQASECRCDKRLPSHLAMVIRCENGCYAMQCLLPGKIKRYDCPLELAALLCDQASEMNEKNEKQNRESYAEDANQQGVVLNTSSGMTMAADRDVSLAARAGIPTDMAGAHGGSHVKDPPPPSSPSPELNQLSKSQEAGIASKSERSIGPKHDWKNIPSQIEAQTAVRSSESLSLDDPTPAQASLRQEGNITSKAVSLSKPVLALSTDEVYLHKLCYMPTGIKQFIISPNGGTIALGSDASLKVSPGTVAEETLVHYAILLHGSFVFPPGYKLGSVIVYLNMDGVRLMKPVSLFLSHWCIKKDGDGEDTLKFFRASHTLEVEQQKYAFQELKREDSDLTTRINVGVLTIQRSQCLYCVACTTETTARYSAITFSQYIQSEDTLYFRIQFTCASLTWNEDVTHLLCKKWKKASISDAVARFQYTDNKQPITARPRRLTGPGWEAAIDGHQAIVEDDFLSPRGKSASEIEREITSGHFPPCIHYKIVYTSPENLRVKPGMMMIDVDGANVPLSFSCRVQEEKLCPAPTLPMSPTSCGAVSATPPPPNMETVTIDAESILDFFYDSFIKWTDANTVVHGLRCKKIISDGDLTEIRRNPDAQQQNEILHRCLKRSCDEEALVEVCDMMIAVDGNRKMNALGRKMKCKLEGN